MQERKRTLRKGQDPKDHEVYPAPPTYHDIKCRLCEQVSTVRMKFTRLCNTCRAEGWVKNMLNCPDPQAWDNVAIGEFIPSRKRDRWPESK